MKKFIALIVIIFIAIVILGSGKKGTPAAPDIMNSEFSNPQKVTVAGYGGDIMEPFVSRDGNDLFFNNSNDPKSNTNLHYATRDSATHFTYKGEVSGVNTKDLDGVASLDNSNNLYFISTRSYAQSFETVFTGTFSSGVASNVHELVSDISRKKLGWLDMDAEISNDGNTLYYAENIFGSNGLPTTSDILFAKKQGGEFKKDPQTDVIMKNVNSSELEYAPATNKDQTELYFTRGYDLAKKPTFKIYVAKRASVSEPFGVPEVISAITGFVEGPTISGDGTHLYYHKKVGDKYELYVVER